MCEKIGTCGQLIDDYTENYMEKLFYFCLKKTGDQNEAEDLTQDISLQIISALSKGMLPANFPAWVWQIARNRYSAWAKNKHKRTEMHSGCDIQDHEIEDEDGQILDSMIQKEQMMQLRRELAFIKSDYRNIVVAYYLENKPIREIAHALTLPANTVKTRLFRAREILKEGMDMAREFGKRSYDPEQVSFVMNGRDGKNGQPWSIVTHLLYKNIFLEAYENPQSAEQLSLELGIALPYMEDELEYLVREQLLSKTKDRYQTAFKIISKEEQRRIHENNKSVQKALTEKICELIDTYIDKDGSKVNCGYVGYEAAKWTLIVRTFDWMRDSANESNGTHEDSIYKHPARPDDGAWTITGYETIDWKKPDFVGQHGYFSYDKNEVKKDVNFGQYKFVYNNIQERTPMHLSWREAYTLWLVCSGCVEKCEGAYIEKLLEYDYIKNDGSVIPNVVVFYRNAKAACDGRTAKKLKSLRDDILGLFMQAPGIERGYIVEQAILDGWLKYDDGTINSIGAYIYL